MRPILKSILFFVLIFSIGVASLAAEGAGPNLRIEVPQNLYAHLWQEISLGSADHIELEAKMLTDSRAGWTWAPGIHLVWIPERAYARIVQQQNGTFNVTGTVDQPVYPVNTWIGLKLEVTQGEIRHWARLEGQEWELIATTPRGSNQEGPPTAIAIGKGASSHGTLMRSHATPGNTSEAYFDDIILRVDGEVLIHESFDSDLAAWLVFADPQAPEGAIAILSDETPLELKEG